MRFALQTCIGAAHNIDPEMVRIELKGSAHRSRQPTPSDQPPLTAPIEELCQSVVDMIGEGSSATEATTTSVMAVVKVPDSVKNQLRPALLRIVRAAGKAHGFPAMAHISSSAAVA